MIFVDDVKFQRDKFAAFIPYETLVDGYFPPQLYNGKFKRQKFLLNIKNTPLIKICLNEKLLETASVSTYFDGAIQLFNDSTLFGMILNFLV